MKRALLKNTRQKFKLHEIEKDLNESILSRKRENLMETPGGGTCRIFGNKSLKPDIRTTDSNPVANNGNGFQKKNHTSRREML
jgi:hypothetical protein